MKNINLKDFYSSLYSCDHFYDVPDEVAELLVLYKQREQAYRQKAYRHKAYYSLDRCDGIDHEALGSDASAEEMFLEKAERTELFQALSRLTDKQRKRLYAHYFLNMSYESIARMENVQQSTIRRSVQSALKQLKIIYKIF